MLHQISTGFFQPGFSWSFLIVICCPNSYRCCIKVDAIGGSRLEEWAFCFQIRLTGFQAKKSKNPQNKFYEWCVGRSVVSSRQKEKGSWSLSVFFSSSVSLQTKPTGLFSTSTKEKMDHLTISLEEPNILHLVFPSWLSPWCLSVMTRNSYVCVALTLTVTWQEYSQEGPPWRTCLSIILHHCRHENLFVYLNCSFCIHELSCGSDHRVSREVYGPETGGFPRLTCCFLELHSLTYQGFFCFPSRTCF